MGENPTLMPVSVSENPLTYAQKGYLLVDICLSHPQEFYLGRLRNVFVWENQTLLAGANSANGRLSSP